MSAPAQVSLQPWTIVNRHTGRTIKMASGVTKRFATEQAAAKAADRCNVAHGVVDVYHAERDEQCR